MRAWGRAPATTDDNRRSLGCVVVPGAFYKRVVEPVLGRGKSITYVMPENGDAREVFATPPWRWAGGA